MGKINSSLGGKIWNRNFICVLLGNFCLTLSHSSVYPLVADYATSQLGQGPEMTGFLTGMFFGVSLAMKPVTGPVMTRMDKRLLMIFVFALGGVANLGYAMFHSVYAFVLFRFFSGVQYSLVGALLITAAGENIPEEKMVSGMGIYGASGAVGTAFAPWIGMTLRTMGTNLRDSGFGYTLAFLFASVILFLAVIPCVILRTEKKTREELDSVGVWYKNIVALNAIPITITLAFILISNALFSSYMDVFAQEQSITGISSFYLIMALALTASRPLSGWLTDKFGVRAIMIPAMLIFAGSFMIIGFAGSLGQTIFGAAIAAVGIGAAQPAIQAMCIQMVSPLKKAVASNTMYVGIDFALFMGPLAGGFVYRATGSYATMFKLGAIPVIISLICFIFVYPSYARHQSGKQSD